MLDWFRRRPDPATPETAALPEATPESTELQEKHKKNEKTEGLFSRFRAGLAATRDRLAGRLETLLAQARPLDDALLDELEELLIAADLGVKTAADLLSEIRKRAAKKELKDAEALKEALARRLTEMLSLPAPEPPWSENPLVFLVAGVNGVGKTTTIAKLASRFKDSGRSVLLAAGDTFRSAAVEQLSVWAERLGVDLVAQPTGADPSAVVFDALIAAQARGLDTVLIDTAGRLHTKTNLMEELKKIKRTANKALPGAPHHTILVLDGNTGRNALRQAQIFHEAVGVDSVIVAKLDGTAKGGAVVSIAHELKIPIAFVGLGEALEDLRPFEPEAFVRAILAP